MGDVTADVCQLVAHACAVEAATVKPDGRLVEYGMDSIRAVDLLVSLEERFGIEISDAEASALKTVGDIVRCIEAKKA
jgi:acyl carrier protein